jgi:hypothetical protein
MNKMIWKLVGSAGTIGICLFLSGHVSARQIGPLKLDNQIKEWIESADDPRTQYGLIAEQLRKKGLSVEFVVGAANPRFIGIDPSLWSKSFDFDFFSKTQAFGRYFCVGQPEKSVTKPTIVVRADEPGDTLVHEFLHHLQSQRSDTVCELYQRMAEATAVSAQDKLANSILEYEVVPNNQGETVVRTRAKEWLQYKWMVEAMRRQVILEQEASDRPMIAEKLSDFVTNQLAKMKTNFWLHELGHVLGLGQINLQCESVFWKHFSNVSWPGQNFVYIQRNFV